MAIKSVTAQVDNTQYPLTYNESSGKYEAQATAPETSSASLDGNYYPVSVTAENMAGTSVTVSSEDETFGQSLRLYVATNTEPEIEIFSPSDGDCLSEEYITIIGAAYSELKETPDVEVTINGVSKGNATYVSDVDFEMTVQLDDGENEITLTVSDVLGSVKSKTIHVIVDKYPPVFISVSVSPSKLNPGGEYEITAEVE